MRRDSAVSLGLAVCGSLNAGSKETLRRHSGMQCPSCGALQEAGVEQCPVCEVTLKASEPMSPDPADSLTVESESAKPHQSQSKLIEFPGVFRSTVPQWRKELSERVREVQEKRAREAALESAEYVALNSRESSEPPLLELLPHAEVAPLNPLVTAALRRIERAHQAAQGTNRMSATPSAAVAYEEDYCVETLPEFEIAAVAAIGSREPQMLESQKESQPVQPEKPHNLVVVPPIPRSAPTEPTPKPRRMIAENDPALNYLDSVPTSLRVDVVKYRHAPAYARILGAIIDLIVVAAFCSPFAALVQLTNGDWRDPRVIATVAILFAVMSFLYFTISTALTGRTWGLRLFSLRVVDARTGLIPTGKQSAGRALVYLGTILTLGLAALYFLIDRDKQTAHDRLTRTTVITV